jgi:hypothetical protein
MSGENRLHLLTQTLTILLTAGAIAWMGQANSRGEIRYEQDSKGNRKLSGDERDKSKDPDLSAITDKRQKRQLRWILAFNTKDAKDYAKQLQELGAILRRMMERQEKTLEKSGSS